MKTLTLSPEAQAVVENLKKGGSVRVAGMTRTRFIVWRNNAQVGPVFDATVHAELLNAGLLTEKTHRLRWKALP
jgi:hypothetical protein